MTVAYYFVTQYIICISTAKFINSKATNNKEAPIINIFTIFRIIAKYINNIPDIEIKEIIIKAM